MKTRAEIAQEESTADPIFLLQVGRLVITNHLVESCAHCGAPVAGEAPHECSDGLAAAANLLVDMDMAQITWRTVEVYLNREEAEARGRQVAHRFPLGWRVYCVPAGGQLRTLLQGLDRLAEALLGADVAVSEAMFAVGRLRSVAQGVVP